MVCSLLLLLGIGNAQAGLFGPPEVKTTGFGVGVVAGDPTGLSFAWRPGSWDAMQAGVGWNARDGGIDGHLDYLRTLAVAHVNRDLDAAVYVGLGGELTSAARGVLFRPDFMKPGGPALSARAPLGSSLFFDRVPLELFAQVVPYLSVIPSTGLGIDGALGARWYF